MKFKMYQIYSFPNCEKCHKALSVLKERQIPYEEISAATSDGRTKLREFTKKYSERLEREIKDGIKWTKMPLIVRNDDGQVEIFQGEEGLAKILEGK